MPDSSDLALVHVDFNDMDAEGRFFVLGDDVCGELRLNSNVTLYDAEGNSAQGTVVELRADQAAVVAMTAGSWRRGPTIPVPETASFEQLVSNLLASSLLTRGARTWNYYLTMTSEIVGQSASPSALPQSEGAVRSSL